MLHQHLMRKLTKNSSTWRTLPIPISGGIHFEKKKQQYTFRNGQRASQSRSVTVVRKTISNRKRLIDEISSVQSMTKRRCCFSKRTCHFYTLLVNSRISVNRIAQRTCLSSRISLPLCLNCLSSLNSFSVSPFLFIFWSRVSVLLCDKRITHRLQ